MFNRQFCVKRIQRQLIKFEFFKKYLAKIYGRDDVDDTLYQIERVQHQRQRKLSSRRIGRLVSSSSSIPSLPSVYVW